MPFLYKDVQVSPGWDFRTYVREFNERLRKIAFDLTNVNTASFGAQVYFNVQSSGNYFVWISDTSYEIPSISIIGGTLIGSQSVSLGVGTVSGAGTDEVLIGNASGGTTFPVTTSVAEHATAAPNTINDGQYLTINGNNLLAQVCVVANLRRL